MSPSPIHDVIFVHAVTTTVSSCVEALSHLANTVSLEILSTSGSYDLSLPTSLMIPELWIEGVI